MPAPPGVRIAPILLARTGELIVDGVTVTHPGVKAALWAGLRRGPDGWRVDALGGTRAVQVEDVPYFVRGVSGGGDAGPLVVELVDGATEPLQGPLRISRDGVLYAPVRGELARFLRPAQAQMAPFLRGSEGAGWEIVTGESVMPVLALEEAA
jgi:hypothetical protein